MPGGTTRRVLAALLVVLRVAAGRVSGRWLTVRIRWTPARRRLAWAVLTVFLAVMEGNQQSHATLLQGHR